MRCAVPAALWGWLLVCLAGAQDRNWDGWDLVMDPSFSRNPDRQVLRPFRVPEAAEPERLIRSASESIAKGHYSDAVDDLHEVITAYGEKVFQAGREGSSRSGRSFARFVGAAELAHYLLANLPPEGREVYDAFARKRALDDLERARAGRDLRALEETARIFATSSVGVSAHSYLADYYLEQGEVELASVLLKKCLLFSKTFEPRILFRLARALDQAGCERDAASYLEAAEFPGETGKSIREDLERNPPLVQTGGMEWPTVGGGADRNRAMPYSAGAGFASRLWMRSIFNETLRDQNPFLDDPDGPVPFQIVRTGEALVISDSVSVSAVSVYSGELLWHFKGPLEALDGSRDHFSLEDYNRRSYSRQAGTVTPHLIAGATAAGPVLLVNLQAERPHRKRQYLYRQVINKPIPVRHLFALSLVDGSLLWRQNEDDPDPESFMNRLSIQSPPVVVGDRVYCEGHLIEGGVRTFLLCFDLHTGALIWRTAVGVGQQQLTMFNMNFREFAATPLSVYDGTVYACSNLGFMAAVDALTGSIRWITEYENIELPEISHYTNPTPRAVYWYNTPPLVSGSVCVAAPLDSEYAVSFDRNTGKALWTFPAERLCASDCRYLMGIRGDRVILGGGGGATALELDSGRMAWRTPSLLDEKCLGRGALTEESAFFSLGDRLVVIDVSSGKITAEHAMRENLMEGQSLFLLGDVTARVSVDALRVSFDSAGMLRKALARIDDPARSGDDAALFKDLVFVAGIYKNEGELDKAAEFYKRALSLAGAAGPDALKRVQSGLFRVYLEKGNLALEMGLPNRAKAAFRAAAEAAPGSIDDLRASLELVELLFDNEDWEEFAVVLSRLELVYGDQVFDFEDRFGLGACRVGFFVAALRSYAAEMQNDPAGRLAALRVVLERYPDERLSESIGGERAWDWAAASIAEIVEEEGRGIYAPYEARAEAAFTAAVTAGSSDLLLDVSARYPNSEIAPRAVLERARLLLAEARAADAYRSLSALTVKKELTDETPHAYYLMARASEMDGNSELANALFDRVRRRYGGVPALWEEGVTYSQLIPESKTRTRSIVAPSPLPRGPYRETEEVFDSTFIEMLDVTSTEPGANLGNRVLLRLFRPERLVLYDFVENRTVWECGLSVIESGDPRIALLAGGVLAVCYDENAVGIESETGRTLWERSLPGWVVDVHTISGLLVIVHGYSEVDDDTVTVESLNPVTGSTLWTREILEGSIFEIIRSPDVLAALAAREILYLLDPLTGAVMHRRYLDYASSDTLYFESPPGRLLLRIREKGMNDNFLLALNSFTGEEAWKFSLGKWRYTQGSVVRFQDGVVVVAGVDGDAGYEKNLYFLDGLTGMIARTFNLAPLDLLFTGNSSVETPYVFIRPNRVNRGLGISAVHVNRGAWSFEDVALELEADGGRARSVQEGVYAADGLIVTANYQPTRRDQLAMKGRVFFLDGASGDIIYRKDVRASANSLELSDARDKVQVALRPETALLLCGDRLICIRGTK